MKKAFYAWRYYMLSREDYTRCMKQVFPSNLFGMWLVGIWFAVFSFVFATIGIVPNTSYLVAGVYVAGRGIHASYFYYGISILTILFVIYVWNLNNKVKQGKYVSKALIYVLVISLYMAFILTGTYMSVWANPTNGVGVAFMVLLICSIGLVAASPILNFSLVLIGVAIFVISSVLIKEPQYWYSDITNVSYAAPAAIMFNWFTNVLKMSSALNGLKLADEKVKYQRESTIDELTQLGNRRDFDRRLKRYLSNSREDDKYLCFAIIDIDFFKKYNDHYGHPKGDDCLRAIGGMLRDKWDNPSVYAARLGGEEFALLWFEKDKEIANNIVAQLQQRIRELDIPHIKSDVAGHITVSIGVCVISSSRHDNCENSIYSSADNALYEAKKSGRNCAVIVDEHGNLEQ